MTCHLQTEDSLTAPDPSVPRISGPVYGLVVPLYATGHDRSAPELALFASKVLDEDERSTSGTRKRFAHYRLPISISYVWQQARQPV